MTTKSIVLVGSPDSGKSNFIGRLWLALQSRKFSLVPTHSPDDIKYVEGLTEHILQGRFAPRTEKEEDNRNFSISITAPSGISANLIIPDVSGELWKKAVETLEIPNQWMSALKESSGALLFVRVLSDLNTQPLDWVNSKRLLECGLGDLEQNKELPTQVVLIELLRFLESSMVNVGGRKPKIAVIVSAWDKMSEDDASKGPVDYLQNQFPLFAGNILDTRTADVKVFGTSILGGDFLDEVFRSEYLRSDLDEHGYVIVEEEGVWKQVNDITIPITWLISHD